jgi:hypothetical protein
MISAFSGTLISTADLPRGDAKIKSWHDDWGFLAL